MDLVEHIRQFQFRDIRPKAASEIDDLGHASRLLGHSKEQITKTVYRRVGEIVEPTRCPLVAETTLSERQEKAP